MGDRSSRSPFVVGPALGLLLAGAVLAFRGTPGPPPAAPVRVLSDSTGALDELVVQWADGSEPVSGDALRAFLGSLDAAVTVHVVVPDDAALASFRRAVGETECRIDPIVVGHAMTGWSRDRWLALGPDGGTTAVTLVAPRVENGAAVWPARAGDARIAGDLAAALGPERVRAARIDLEFDGGDVVADDETAFVAPAVLARNLGRTVHDRGDLVDRLRRLLGRRVVLLDGAPDHHAGMFVMPIGGGRVLVGDPGLARGLVSADHPAFAAAGGIDFDDATRARFDAVAAACAKAGYDVVRVPVAPGRDGRTWWTPLNAVLETRDGEKRVWMPAFGHAAFDDAAERAWRAVGYDVVRVDCSRTFARFGSLRCLVNVLRRA